MNYIVFFSVFLLYGWNSLQAYLLKVDGAGRFPRRFILPFLPLMTARDPLRSGKTPDLEKSAA